MVVTMFLDTTFCIDLMRERRRRIEGPATTKLRSLAQFPIYLSVFAACELHAGARMIKKPASELRRLQMFLELLEIVLPEPSFPVAYGEAEAQLRKKGRPIPTMDLLIGITAKVHGMPLLTRDSHHFGKIPGLVVETY
jgi:tRNA(fMet)-specific endonuclease VapC